jgi:hypothetical protein
MGDPPIDNTPGMELLKSFLKAQNINTLWDISLWQSDGTKDWASWNLPVCPLQIPGGKRVVDHSTSRKIPNLQKT